MTVSPDPAERLKIAGHGPPATAAEAAADHLKMIDLTLAWHGPLQTFEIINITNTTYYVPGQFLSKDQVTRLCTYPHWRVSMSQFDVIAFVSKLAGILPIHIF